MSDTVRVSEPLLRLSLLPFTAATTSTPLMPKVSFLPFSPWKPSSPVWNTRFSLMPWANWSAKPSGAVRAIRPSDGPFSISGTVSKYANPSNLPLKRRVRLLLGDGINVVRETWSGENGDYSFSGIASNTYVVIAYDYQNTYRAVIADRVDAV